MLKRLTKKLDKDGYTAYLGPELEYFYFKAPQRPHAPRRRRLLRQVLDDIGTELRSRTVEALQAMGISVEAPTTRWRTASTRSTSATPKRSRWPTRRSPTATWCKEIARQGGYYATFMPKPVFGQNGAGCTSISRSSRRGKNVFFDARTSTTSRSSAAPTSPGCSRTCAEIASITNQWVNSYKRLVPGFEAPVYIAWGQRNRSALVRVPMYKPGQREGDPDRAALPGSGLQSLPRVLGLPGRRAQGDRRRLHASSAGGGRHLRDGREGAEGARHREPPRQPGRGRSS